MNQKQSKMNNNVKRDINANRIKNMQQALADKMAENVFPEELIPDKFKMWLDAATAHESQRTLEIDWENFKVLLTGEPTAFTLAQMGYALNAIESKSMVQLGIDAETYIHVQDRVCDMCVKWNMITASLKEDVQKQFNGKPGVIFQPNKIIQA